MSTELLTTGFPMAPPSETRSSGVTGGYMPEAPVDNRNHGAVEYVEDAPAS
jgi:hypothetical protein